MYIQRHCRPSHSSGFWRFATTDAIGHWRYKLYTATVKWIDETPHVISSLTVVEIGEDKKGHSAASRRGRGRGP